MKKLLAISLLAMGVSTSAFADDLLDTITADGSFKTFVSAIKAADLTESFKAAGPITVFAPNDAAFAKLPKAKLKALLANKEELAKLINHHLVAGKIGKADVDAGKVKTVEGSDLALSVSEGVKVDNVKVIGSEIDADNGVIHVVENVLKLKK
ncbi:MAG TPA: fasciclin domain-containing protein [Methylophilaceae bacterium]|nr:fasciclin domain-containing protein [Methylophilaceae bacterium]